MSNPWNRTRPEQPRRPATAAGRSWQPAPFPKTPSKAEREQFVMRLLAALPGPDEEPVSTSQLGDQFHLDQYLRSNLLYNLLVKLARQGRVEKVAKEGERARYWRRAPAGEHQSDDAAARL